MALKEATPYMLKLQQRLVDELDVAETTAKQWIQTLYRMNGSKPFKNLSWSKDYAAVQGTLEPLAQSTKTVYYRVLGRILGLFPSYRAHQKYWNSLSESTVVPETAEKSESQKKNWIEWSDVLKKQNELAQSVGPLASIRTGTTLDWESYTKLLDFIVLSLYTEIPPRRNKDYALMYVVPEYKTDMDPSFNYYDVKNSIFIFNDYKTAYKYGQQIVSVPEKLKEALDLYLRFHPLRALPAYPLLVNSDAEPLHPVNGITRLLNRLFDKNVGSSMLRHSYLSYKYGGSLTEKEADATAMAHRISTQNYYIKK